MAACRVGLFSGFSFWFFQLPPSPKNEEQGFAYEFTSIHHANIFITHKFISESHPEKPLPRKKPIIKPATRKTHEIIAQCTENKDIKNRTIHIQRRISTAGAYLKNRMPS